MNTGIIMIGLSLVLLSVGLISSPASAALAEESCGSAFLTPDFPHGFSGISLSEANSPPSGPAMWRETGKPCHEISVGL